MANTGASAVLGLSFPVAVRQGPVSQKGGRSGASGAPQRNLTLRQFRPLLHHSAAFASRSGCLKVRGSMATKVIYNQNELDDESCELVNGTELVIEEGDESIHAYLLNAVKNNNGAGVLLLPDIFGFKDSSTRDFAYRVACNGYNVLVPDLFHGNPWEKGHSMGEFELWIAKHQLERVTKAIDLCAKWMIDQFTTAGIVQNLGIVGFGFGGGCLIKALALDEQAYFGTAVCYYGSDLDPSLASNIKVPVLFVCGDSDPLCPVNTVKQMEKSIQGSMAVIYEGRGHGFAHRPESQEDDQAAEDAFSIMRSWLQDQLHIMQKLSSA